MRSFPWALGAGEQGQKNDVLLKETVIQSQVTSK